MPGVPHWFENLLPEQGTELRRRLCAAHGLREGQSFALLEALGGDLVGAVRTVPAEVEGEPVVVDAKNPDASVDRASPAGAATRVPRGLSALPGAQLKLSMSMLDHRLVVPAQGETGEWLVKFGGDKYGDLAAVEAATMSWARQAGFDVPAHHCVPVADLLDLPFEGAMAPMAYAIRRFDRRDDGTRVHQEDLCQALDLPPGNKFGWWPVVTFDGALRFVTDVCGEEQGREMARRMGFCIAAGNGDAHLKNWSLEWGDRTRPVLAPCYDLVSTISFATLGWTSGPEGPSLALRLGGAKRFDHIDLSALTKLRSHSQQTWAAEELRAGVERAAAAWKDVEKDAPSAMRVALETHRRRVPILHAF